jgi:hypothetical protein
MGAPWVGFDLDGTLAEMNAWVDIYHIGPVIPRMLSIVKWFLNNGYTIKIFTARVSNGPEAIPPIRDWLEANGLPRDLEITNVKDFDCVEIWDDRVIAIESNTGNRLGGASVLDL